MPTCEHCDREAISVDGKRCARHLVSPKSDEASKHVTGYTTTTLNAGEGVSYTCPDPGTTTSTTSSTSTDSGSCD